MQTVHDLCARADFREQAWRFVATLPTPSVAVMASAVGFAATWILILLAAKFVVIMGVSIIVRFYDLVRVKFGSISESLNLTERVKTSTAYEIATTPAFETVALGKNLARVVEANPPPLEMVLSNNIKYDAKGPFVVEMIGGKEIVIRISMDTMLKLQGINKTVSLLPNETGGKEAALPTSSSPHPSEMPSWQVAVVTEDRPIGFGVRVRSNVLLVTRHEYDIMVSCPVLYLQGRTTKIQLKDLKPTGKFPLASDLFALEVGPSVFGSIGTKVAPLGVPIAGPAAVFGNDNLGIPSVSFGSLHRDPSATGILYHNCWTKKGTSGAAIIQNGRIVGLHTGSNDNATVNVATSIRYLPVYLGEAMSSNTKKVNETYFKDDTYDRDYEREQMLDRLVGLEKTLRSEKSEYASLADDIWSDINEHRYGAALMDQDELEEKLERLNAGTSTQQEIRDYYNKQSGSKVSKKALKKFESDDIKGASSEKSRTTPGKPVSPSVMASASSTSAKHVRFNQPRSQRKVSQSSASDEEELDESSTQPPRIQSRKPSSSASLQEAPTPSSTPSNSKPDGLSRPDVAAQMASAKAAWRRRTTTR